ncbi:MAG: sigma-70 family RNA polymerase sigma factor [Cyclobacteriaceae bacterium]
MGLPEKENRKFQKTNQHGLMEGTWKIGEISKNTPGNLSLQKVKEPENEQQLWIEFRQGNEDSFAQIYNKYILSMYNYGERITSDKELIEDSIHDVFVELWKQRSSIGQAFSIKHYLFKALKRKIVYNLTRERRIVTNKLKRGEHDFEIVLSPEFHLITNEASEQQKESLQKAINFLSKRQKEAITLKFYDNLSFKEVADLLSISVKSTYTLIYRAIDILKLHIEKIYFLLIWLG